MSEDVKRYIQGGIYFSNELMDTIEDISLRYKDHISVSLKIGHFDELDKIMMKLARVLIRYNQQYTDLLKDIVVKEEVKEETGLETILE